MDVEQARDVIERAMRLDMTKPPATHTELREVLDLLTRPLVVYAVEWGNELPAEIDTIWLLERDALIQAHKRNGEVMASGGWKVVPWTVRDGHPSTGATEGETQ